MTSPAGAATDEASISTGTTLRLAAISEPSEETAGAHPVLAPAYCLVGGPVALALSLVALAVIVTDTTPTAIEVTRLVIASLWAGAGVLLGLRRSRDRLAPIVLTGAVLGSIALIADSLAVHRETTSVLVDAAVRLAAALVVGVVFHFLVALPDGRLSTRGRQAAVLTGYCAAIATGVVMLGTRDHVRITPLVLLLGAALAIGVPAGNSRYRRAGAIDRRRMQWIGCAITSAATVVVTIVALDMLADWPQRVPAIALAITGLVPLAVMAGTHQAFIARVDNLLAHTVAFAGLTLLVITIYVVVILGFGRAPTGSERSLLVLSMIAAAVAALGYVPARDRLADVANRLVYGERTAPDQTLRTFGQRMTRAIPLDELLLQLVESFRKTMHLKSAEVWTGSGGGYEIASAVPHRRAPRIVLGDKELPVVARAGVSGGTWIEVWLSDLIAGRDPTCLRVAPLAHAGELLGFVVLERHGDGENFSEADDLIVTEVARQVSMALHNVQLDSALQASLDQLRAANDELRSSRARIVAAGDAERRRLERNLHDGAQQYLVAMAVKIRLTRDAVEDGAPDVLDLLDELKKDMSDAVAELRALAHGIFPPQLVAGGLTEALPSAATRAALPTTVDVLTAARYPTEIEAAVYFCVLEALQNAGKHGGDGAEAVVRVWEDADRLHFSVVDDGVGFAPDDARRGHGFVNMSDRLGAYGGTFTLDAGPGRGVSISGSIPVPDGVAQTD